MHLINCHGIIIIIIEKRFEIDNEQESQTFHNGMHTLEGDHLSSRGLRKALVAGLGRHGDCDTETAEQEANPLTTCILIL